MNHGGETAHCRHTQHIERLFTGTAAPEELDEIYQQLRQCPACVRQFERYARAEAALAPTPTSTPTGTPCALTNESRARVERRLLGAAESTPGRPARAWFRTAAGGWHRWAAITAAVGGSAFVGISGTSLSPSSLRSADHAHTFQARGPAPLDPAHGLRALRIREQNGELSVEDLSDGRSLRPGDRIKVFFTELKGWNHVGIQARWPDGTVELVRSGNPSAGGVNQDVGPTLAVPLGMRGGPFRLVAAFGATARPKLDVEAEERDGSRVAIRVVRSEIIATGSDEP